MKRRSVGNVQRITRERGVSLIELMVSLVIGLLLIGGAVTVYLQSKSTYTTSETVARLQETGRYALSIIEPDVRLAGFWGMTNRAEGVENTVADTAIVNNCAAGWIGDAARAIDAINGDGTAGAYTLSCTATNRSTGADVLMVRRAASKVAAAVSASQVQVQSNRVQAVVFKNASMPAGFTAAASQTRDMVANVYYVSQSANRYSLRRRSLAGSTMVDEEVIPGIQDLQVQFGIDTTNDGTADRYDNPGTVGAGRIVAARIWLLIVADDREMGFSDPATYQYANASYPAFTDGRRRILLSKTIQIRNSRP
jgi:type IV pilus assembly protein PilW